MRSTEFNKAQYLHVLGRLSPSAKVVEHTSITGSWEQDSACLGFVGEMASIPARSQQVREGKKGNQSKGSGCTVAQRCDKSLGWVFTLYKNGSWATLQAMKLRLMTGISSQRFTWHACGRAWMRWGNGALEFGLDPVLGKQEQTPPPPSCLPTPAHLEGCLPEGRGKSYPCSLSF